MLEGRALGRCVRFSRPFRGFGASYVLDPGERQQIALLRSVEKIRSGDRALSARFRIAQGDGAHEIAGEIRRHRLMARQHSHTAGAHEWREHFFQHG